MRFITVFFMLFPAIYLPAQNLPGLHEVVVDTSAYLPAQHYRAAGISYKSTKDRALSPLLFQGPGLAFSTTSWKYNNQWLWQSAFDAQGHLLQNAPGSSLLTSAGLNYQLAALRELKELQQGKWRFWAGPEARMLLNLRMHSNNVNNIASYDWATVLGVSGMLSKEFTLWKRSFAVSNQLQLPLFYLYARPPYAWGIPPPVFEEQEGAWKEAFQFGTLNTILLVKNQLNLDFYLRKKKKGKLLKYTAYRIAYAWNYFQVSSGNPLQSGGHDLMFSRVITF